MEVKLKTILFTKTELVHLLKNLNFIVVEPCEIEIQKEICLNETCQEYMAASTGTISMNKIKTLDDYILNSHSCEGCNEITFLFHDT